MVKNALDRKTVIRKLEKMKGGLFNTTYFIKTDYPAKSLVLRIAPIRPELLLNFEKNIMAVEPMLYGLFRENSIPYLP
ncbi:MAG: hypothetical protein Q7J78_00700 [Clostridiales bacterium]|nr:hypothetical protein [Clostridiales bacterium]